ncbi:MAG: hypothetical protein JSU96_01580 [Acidobacteriota bacterium]|nr:MAG: hypothetical protein JSU96_01580 [Acidobacteriota bacterium]
MSKRGVGEKARWEVVLADGRRIDGYTLSIEDESFTLADRKTQENFEIAYSEINGLRPKVHTSRGVKIAVIAGVAVGAVLAIGALVLANSKGD